MLSKLIERIDIWESDIKIKFRISMEEFVGTGDSRISTDSDVAEPPLIRGLVLDKLVIKLKSKTEYEIIM